MKRLALILVALVGCDRVDVDIADPPADSCTNNEDCRDGGFCDVHDCDGTMGHCVELPVTCDAMHVMGGAVCGCDNVTYANDCLRLQARTGFSKPYACP